MESLLIYVPIVMAIACPVSMALMMWYMGRSQGHSMSGMSMTPPVKPNANLTPAERDAQVVAMQQQLQTLQEQIHTLEASAPNPTE